MCMCVWGKRVRGVLYPDFFFFFSFPLPCPPYIAAIASSLPSSHGLTPNLSPLHDKPVALVVCVVCVFD